MATRTRLRSHRPIDRQRGIALVLALWLTILLTVIASGFAFSMRGEALAAHRERETTGDHRQQDREPEREHERNAALPADRSMRAQSCSRCHHAIS